LHYGFLGGEWFAIKWRPGCQAFTAKINLIHMRPVGILSMLYFAQNALFYQNHTQRRTRQKGANDLDAVSASPVRAPQATAPGSRIVRAWRTLSHVKS
jgi:hypothetical protein